MKKKKSDVQISIDKRVSDIENWGILTLMSNMKNAFLFDLERDRQKIANFSYGKYEDSPLQAIDKITAAFNRTYDREFEKIYKQVVKEYEVKSDEKINQS